MPNRKLQRIIVVEDDAEMRRNLVKYLNNEGYEALAVGSALDFYRSIDYSSRSLAIIDIGLPDQSGMVLVEYLKKNTDIYIVGLLTNNTLEERLACYKAGADVILVKPYYISEIAALIRNIYSRFNYEWGDIVRKGGNQNDATVKACCEVVMASNLPSWTLMSEGWLLITPGGDSIELTLREYKFIQALSRSDSIAVTRKELLQMLEYQNDEYGNRALESLVHRLRTKTAIYGSAPIKTAHGVGYSFAALVNIL